MITKNTANKRPPARTVFCFTDILIPLANYQHMEFVEEESINDSEQKLRLRKRLRCYCLFHDVCQACFRSESKF